MSLDTLANVKARLGITTSADDSLLDLLRDTADAFIEQYVGRSFEAGTLTEYHAGNRPVVRVRNYPIDSVTSLRVDPTSTFGSSTEWAASNYFVDVDRGLIWSKIGAFLPGLAYAPTVRVVYTTSAAVPADVKQAYSELVGHWYRHVKTMVADQYQNVTQQTFGNATAIFAKGQIAGLPLPDDIARLLGPYREIPL